MQLLTWWQALPMALAILLALYLPGGVLVRLTGRRSPAELLALAPLPSLALAGVDGIIFARVGLSWGWVSYLASAAIMALIIGLVGWSLPRLRGTGVGGRGGAALPPENGRADSPSRPAGSGGGLPARTGVKIRTGLPSPSGWLPALTGVLLAAVTTVMGLIHAVPSPEQVTQNYDTVFHYNVVGRILMTGQATSLHALPGIRDVYPVGFHEFAALGDLAFPSLPISAAVTCTWLVFAALVWPISMLFLVRRAVGARPATDLLAGGLSACCAGFPFLLLDWGTLYPMFAAQAILPVFLGLLWTWCRKDWRRPDRVLPSLAWVILACVAVSFAHFRVLLTGLLLAAPLVLVWLFRAGAALRRRSRRLFHWALAGLAALILAVGGVGGLIFVRMYLRHNTRPISGHLNGGFTRPADSMAGAMARFLTGQPIDSAYNRLPVFWPLAVLLLVCLLAVLAEHREEGLILAASFLLLGFVFVACDGTHADWAKVVTALWYKDQRRLFAAWPIVAIPLICRGLTVLVRWGSGLVARGRVPGPGTVTSSTFAPAERHGGNRTWRPGSWLAVLLALAFVFVCSFANPQLDAMEGAVGRAYAFAGPDADSPMLSRDEYLLLKRLDRHVAPGDEVLADPWNGSAFVMAMSRRVPYYAHLNTVWDQDHLYLARTFSQSPDDPRSCSILKDNNVRWYLDMQGPYMRDDPQHAPFAGLHPVPRAMQEVDRQGRAVLYRITSCGL